MKVWAQNGLHNTLTLSFAVFTTPDFLGNLELVQALQGCFQPLLLNVSKAAAYPRVQHQKCGSITANSNG